MRNIHLFLFVLTLLFAACETGNQRDKLFREIKKAEKEIFSKDAALTLEKSQHLMDLYRAFAEEFPQDSLTPEFLFSCAAVASASQQELFAITLYQRIYDEYPDHAVRPIALLNQAVMYENMGDADRAKPLYEQFLVMFPDHPYAIDVELLLEMVGKSPEEMEEMFMQQFENQEE